MLAAHGYIAEHVNDTGLRDAAGLILWTYAIEQGAVLVSKNEDFRDMLILRGSPPAVVWVRVGNARRQALLEWFQPLNARVVSLIESGDDLIGLR
jgi:predicted nuclease of predicted toxin-antitoxin system